MVFGDLETTSAVGENGKKVLTIAEYIEREDLLELYRMDDPVLNENGHVPLPVIRQSKENPWRSSYRRTQTKNFCWAESLLRREEGRYGMLICTCPNEMECPALLSDVVCFPWREYLEDGDDDE